MVDVEVVGFVFIDEYLEVSYLIFDLRGQKQIICRKDLELFPIFVFVLVLRVVSNCARD